MNTPYTDPNSSDTICAISTPPGVGGIAIVRLSGPNAISIADSAWRGRSLLDTPSHTARFGSLLDLDGNELDQCLATVFRAPHSFTGDDTVEFGIHGSRWLQREVLNMLIKRGARIAQPGEYTRRAFASGKLDLTQAEAVADLIASTSRASHRIAMNQMRGKFSERLTELRQKLLELASLLELELDFSEEEVEFASRSQLLNLSQEILSEIRRLHTSFRSGAAIKDGIPTAIVGATNAGKSSLLNAILGEDRAIVSDIHGTTRDTIEDTIEIGDYLFRFIDTAGLRNTDNTIEQLGIERSIQAIKQARIIIVVIDSSTTLDNNILKQAIQQQKESDTQLIIALNKSDLSTNQTTQDIIQHLLGDTKAAILKISAKNDLGIDNLRESLVRIATQQQDSTQGENGSEVLITNARHAEALFNAAQSTSRVIDGLNAGISGDFIAQDLRETLHHLSAITGTITTPDILSSIFKSFCIGK